MVLGDHEDVFADTVYANKLNFMPFEKLEGKLYAKAKVRYKHEPADCTIEMVGEDKLKCVFKEPQRAITPGQALVIYQDDIVAVSYTHLTLPTIASV